jgi:hypothetical protein
MEVESLMVDLGEEFGTDITDRLDDLSLGGSPDICCLLAWVYAPSINVRMTRVPVIMTSILDILTPVDRIVGRRDEPCRISASATD